MANISINRVTNANIYMDGFSYLGRAENVDLPEVVYKFTEHKALGMVGTSEFFAGIEKMEGSIKWNSFYQEVMMKVGNPTKTVQLQARSSLETYNSQGRVLELPVVTFLTVAFKTLPAGKYKQHDNVELDSKFTAYYVKQVVGGINVVEIDVLANIAKVNGVDILANYRANIGG